MAPPRAAVNAEREKAATAFAAMTALRSFLGSRASGRIRHCHLSRCGLGLSRGDEVSAGKNKGEKHQERLFAHAMDQRSI